VALASKDSWNAMDILKVLEKNDKIKMKEQINKSLQNTRERCKLNHAVNDSMRKLFCTMA
jgi:hypothetical protein